MFILRNKISQAVDGSRLYAEDITGTTGNYSYGQGGNIAISSVTSTLFYIKNCNDVVSTLIAGDTLSPYLLYKKVSGAQSTINTKRFNVGDSFYFSQSQTVPVGDEWEFTGYYVFKPNWLPDEGELSIDPDLIGQDVSILESVYAFSYNIFYDRKVASFNAEEYTRYLVISGSATYDAQVFLPGEVIETYDTSQISISSGAVDRLYASTDSYFQVDWQIKSDLFRKINAKRGSTNKAFWAKTNEISNRLLAGSFISESSVAPYAQMIESLDLVRKEVDSL